MNALLELHTLLVAYPKPTSARELSRTIVLERHHFYRSLAFWTLFMQANGSTNKAEDPDKHK
jgi:hypothetical protein